MVWLIESVQADKARVDRLLGDGSYDSWMKETWEANQVLAEFEAVKNQVPVKAQAYVTGVGALDYDVLLKAGQDYSWGIERVSKGEVVNPDQLQDIEAIRDMAKDALEVETGILKSAMVVVVLNLFLTSQFSNVQRMAVEAIPKIQKLQSALARARQNATEARVQQMANLGITIIQKVFLPELTVIKRIGIGVGTWALDKALGTDKSTHLSDVVSDQADYGEILAAGIEDWKWLAPGEKSAVKSASKGLSVVGLYFDQDEVNNALKQVEIVNAILYEALASLKRVKALIERLRPGMQHWKMQLQGAARAIKNSKVDAEGIRDNYRQAIASARWSQSNPTVWRPA